MDLQSTIPINGDSDQPWLFAMPGENARWFARFSKYVDLGPMRSIYAVYARETTSKPRSNTSIARAPDAWYTQAHRFDWKKRAKAYDDWRRKEVFAEGLAQDTERVKRLVELGEKMYTKLTTEFDTMVVNDKFVGQLLAVFDLIAKHTGGYVQRLEHTGKDGKAIEVEETKVNVVFYMPEIDPLPDQGDEEPGDPAGQS